jgi:tRNA-2-methylthio-N6-dimethylallyladenosine synthase
MNNEKYYIRAYGCQMNLYEADVISTIMDKAGFVQVSNETEADIVYLVTCSVRSHAENRVLGRLNSLKQLKKSKPDLIIGVLGCMAQNYNGKLSNGHGADLVVGPDEYRRLPELVNKFVQFHTPQIQTEFNTENYEGILPKVTNRPTGFVSIMRGCNNYCSYCIVPYVRGRERSKPKEQVIQEVNYLITNKVKDITLVGQNVLAWHDNGLEFFDLLKIVDGISGFDRLRFITSHPKDLTINHFNILLTLNKFCPHIHLPLQSGSNRVLNLMNRGYTKEEYIQKVKKGREIIQDISFTTDVMVGFPTETDEDFNETLDVIEQLKFDFAYMFKYSERPGTKACEIKPQVNETISQQRLTKLIEIQNQITNEKSKELLDKTLEVLVESKNGLQSYARTKTNKVVIIEEPVETGKTYLCNIIRVAGWTPIGKIVNN